MRFSYSGLQLNVNSVHIGYSSDSGLLNGFSLFFGRGVSSGWPGVAMAPSQKDVMSPSATKMCVKLKTWTIFCIVCD